MNPAESRAERPLPMVLRGFFIVGAMLAFIGGIQLFILSTQTEVYFAWTIQPPLTAAFIGAFFLASSVLFALSAFARTWEGARVTLVTVLPFTSLILIATLLHVDRFHLDSPNVLTRFVTWVWFAVYIILPPVSLALLVYQFRQRFSPQPSFLTSWRSALAIEALIELVLGAALFLLPQAAAPLWPWALTPLTAQVIGAWLVTAGLSVGLVSFRPDYLRFEFGAIGYGGLGLVQLIALARFSGDVAWNHASAWVYLLFLLSMPVLGLSVWFSGRRPAPHSP